MKEKYGDKEDVIYKKGTSYELLHKFNLWL